MTTSTEPLVEPTASSTVAEVETATSSESTPVTEEVTTTTIETIVLTETTSTVPETVNLSTTPPASTTLAVTVTTRVIAYPAFRLHRVYPAPSSGKKEWVEIKLPDGTSLTDLDEYALYDATGRVMRFPPSDMTLISQVDRVMRLQLTSAKLNNGGDTVELRRPDGSVVERMTYPKTTSGQSWIKNAQETAWILEDITEAEVQESRKRPSMLRHRHRLSYRARNGVE